MSQKICRNCSQSFLGNYCSNCGQRELANHRLKWKEVISDFFDNIFNVDKGFFFTIWKLLIEPGNIGRNYINGERKKYTHPIRYLIIAVAVQTFVDYWFLQTDPQERADFFTFSFLSEGINQRMAIINLLLATRYVVIHYLSMIILFPAIFYFLFRKLHFRYIELLTINFYYFGTSLLIILTLLMGGYLLDVSIPVPIIILTTLAYIFWCNFLFYLEVQWWKRFVLLLISILIFMMIRIFLLIYLLSVFFPGMARF